MSGRGRAALLGAIGGVTWVCAAPTWITAILVALSALVLWRGWASEVDETRAREVIRALDAYQGSSGCLSAIACEVAFAARSKYGLLRDNKANRMVIGAFVRDYLVISKPDLRVVDRVRHTPMAIEACFIPLEEDILAYRVRRTHTRCARVAEVGPGIGC